MTECGVQWHELVNTVIDENSYQARCGNIKSGMKLGLRVS